MEPNAASDVNACPAKDGAPLGVESPRAPRALELLARFVEAAAEPEALDRMLLALAVHGDGVGFREARLLRFDAERASLEGVALGSAPDEGLELDRALEWARFADLSPPDAETLAAWQAFRTTPEALSGAPLEAWRGVTPAIGAGGDAESPWRDAPDVGAAVLRRGRRPASLLVGRWGDARPADARERLLALVRLVESTWSLSHPGADAKRRARHAAALGEFLKVGTSSSHLKEALHIAARLAAQGAGARGSAVWCVGDGSLRLEITHGPSGQRERVARALQGVAEAAVRDSAPRALEAAELADAEGVGALAERALVQPLVAYGRVLGALAVHDARGADGAWSAADREFLAALADAVALLMDHASRFDELQRAALQQRELRARVRREERLAAVGERVARTAHEVRNPLASIGAFARRVHRELAEADPHREYLEIVIRETERLEAMFEAQLEHASVEPLRLRPESLNAVVQDVLRKSGELLVRRRIRLLKRLDPALPPLLLDPDRMRIVLHNVLQQAIETVPLGGRIRVESRLAPPYALVDVAHDGPREPGDALERVFAPFASPQGGGFTLALAERIVREHGGEVRVRGESEWTTIVSLTFPIHDNEDRRRPGADRRQARADRRDRFSEA
jgi:signal transduction histidine kinase